MAEMNVQHLFTHTPLPPDEETLECLIQQDYEISASLMSLLRGTYVQIRSTLGSVLALREKYILDIAAGSKNNPDAITTFALASRMYEPWFSRVAQAAGAHVVVGIDRHPSPGEKYTHVTKDLRDPAVLEKLPDHYFDVLNCVAFIPSIEQISFAYRSHLQRKYPVFFGLEFPETSLSLRDATTEQQRYELIEYVTKHGQRVLKEGGYFFWDKIVFRKEKGVLVVQTILGIGFEANRNRNTERN